MISSMRLVAAATMTRPIGLFAAGRLCLGPCSASGASKKPCLKQNLSTTDVSELGDDRELLDLPVLIGSQESIVVFERHAAVRVAVGAEHERMGQQSCTPVDSALPD